MSKASIVHDYSLLAHNTFGVDVSAAKFARFRSEGEFIKLLEQDQNIFLLGGGSNLLLTQDLEALVLKNEIFGIQIHEKTDKHVIVKCGGGEVWDDLVAWSVQLGFGGLENLSLIPGCVGTAPIQNIGAYGVELKDVIQSLEAIELSTGAKKVFENEDCQFAYRDSIFKNQLKGKYCITSVTFKFTASAHQLNLDYGNIKSHLDNLAIEKPTIRDVRDAVIDIRNSKLPNPDELGNSGSFFKNPVVDKEVVDRILKSYPDLKYFPQDNSQFKIPAAWLIDKAGLKGTRKGDAGLYAKHALVLVNHGDATGAELYDFAMQVRQTVTDKFGLELTPEVNVI